MPLVYGAEGIVKSGITRRMQNLEEVRTAFQAGDLEVALLPTIEILQMRDVVVIPGCSSATLGASRLITLFSKRLPGEISRVLVDSEDLGATPLAQLMLSKKIGIRPEFFHSTIPLNPASYDLSQDDGYDAYLLTGRHCFFVRRDQFAFTMDLTLAWYEYTRLPYVLHLWAAKKTARIGALEKELGDVARRNEGNNETAQKAAERLGVTESGVRAVYEKALVTVFDAVITQSFRKLGQELASNRIVQTGNIPLYTAPVAALGGRKV
jgi:predicted solute-binding protein